jgi:hypothetical protein
VYEWLAGQPSGPLIEFPADGLFDPNSVAPNGLFQSIRSMYLSTCHWDPIVAGYSSYIPPGYLELLLAFRGNESGPSMVTVENVGLLQQLGIRWVVIHHADGYDWRAAVASADSLTSLRRVADIGESTVFEVTPSLVGVEPPPDGTFALPGEATSGAEYPALVRFNTPGDTMLLGWLNRRGKVRVEWIDSSGTTVVVESASLPYPVVLAPGDTYRGAVVRAPDAAGTYTVRATLEDGSIEPAEQVVRVE